MPLSISLCYTVFTFRINTFLKPLWILLLRCPTLLSHLFPLSLGLPSSFLPVSISVSQSRFPPHSAVVAVLPGPWVLECRRLPWSQTIAYKHSVLDSFMLVLDHYKKTYSDPISGFYINGPHIRICSQCRPKHVVHKFVSAHLHFSSQHVPVKCLISEVQLVVCARAPYKNGRPFRKPNK